MLETGGRESVEHDADAWDFFHYSRHESTMFWISSSKTYRFPMHNVGVDGEVRNLSSSQTILLLLKSGKLLILRLVASDSSSPCRFECLKVVSSMFLRTYDFHDLSNNSRIPLFSPSEVSVEPSSTLFDPSKEPSLMFDEKACCVLTDPMNRAIVICPRFPIFKMFFTANNSLLMELDFNSDLPWLRMGSEAYSIDTTLLLSTILFPSSETDIISVAFIGHHALTKNYFSSAFHVNASIWKDESMLKEEPQSTSPTYLPSSLGCPRHLIPLRHLPYRTLLVCDAGLTILDFDPSMTQAKITPTAMQLRPSHPSPTHSSNDSKKHETVPLHDSSIASWCFCEINVTSVNHELVDQRLIHQQAILLSCADGGCFMVVVRMDGIVEWRQMGSVTQNASSMVFLPPAMLFVGSKESDGTFYEVRKCLHYFFSLNAVFDLINN